jgi:hypothetical protein
MTSGTGGRKLTLFSHKEQQEQLKIRETVFHLSTTTPA